MKRVFSFALAAALMMAAACNEPLNEVAEEATPQNEAVETTDNVVPGDGPIVLGDKLPNPYSMENMRKAIAELQSRGLSKAALSTDIKPTHYYMRFKPKNEAEVDAVEADTTVFYYSFPLDREIVGGSTNYRDPELPDSVPSYMYCTVPVDHVMPDVEYEIHEELYILEDVNVYDDADDNEDAETSLSKHAKASYWLELKNIALEQVGMEPETPDLSKSWRPNGRVTYYDNSLNKTIPLEGAPVHTIRAFIGHQCCTNANGEFSMPKVNCKHTFFIKWKRADFKVRNNTGLDAAERIIASNIKKKAVNFTFKPDMDIDWAIATVFRGAHYYYYGNIDGLTRPTNTNLTIRVSKRNDGKPLGCYSNSIISSDIHIYHINRTSAELFCTTVHEVGHCAHRGFGSSTYNNCSKIVKESWARGVSLYLARKLYPSHSVDYFGDYTGVVEDLMDNLDNNAKIKDKVSGYSIVQIENALKGAKTWNEWKNNLKNKYNNGTEIYLDDLFDTWSKY
ncbi:MAG: hypothetical protein J6U21_02130 [Bacteroidales bacterium]|nr:hypothetical protein [Bacteroidales bacterium]